MSDTPLIGLPLLEASQAQKHVTHNEALLLLDAMVHLAVISRVLATPPVSPDDGDRYLVAASATGDWLGHSGHIAFREAGAWRFAIPKAGWRLWVVAESLFLLFDGTLWIDLQDFDELQNMDLLGVNTTADAANKLSVASANILFTHAGAGQRVKINKNAAGDTASLLYQTGFSGRAEIGTAGDDDFHFKVSPDGSAWNESFIINKTSGLITIKNTMLLDPQAADPGAPADGQLWYNSTTDTFRKRQNGVTSDLDSGSGSGGTFTAQADPAAPSTGDIELFLRQLNAGVVPSNKLSFMASDGLVTNLQQRLYGRHHYSAAWAVTYNDSSVGSVGSGTALTGTPNASAFSTSSAVTRAQRISIPSAASAGSGAGIRLGTHIGTMRGNAAGRNGFFTSHQFAIGGSPPATWRFLVGLLATPSAMGNVDPSTMTNCVFVGKDVGDTAWQIMSNDGSGTATKHAALNTTDFPLTAGTLIVEVMFYCPPGAAQNIYWHIRTIDADGATVASDGGVLTTDLPVVETGMTWHVWINNGSTAAAATIIWFQSENIAFGARG